MHKYRRGSQWRHAVRLNTQLSRMGCNSTAAPQRMVALLQSPWMHARTRARSHIRQRMMHLPLRASHTRAHTCSKSLVLKDSKP